VTPSDDLQTLDALYRLKLAEFDSGAVRRKWRYQAMWMAITCLTFANMFIAALSEHFSREQWFIDSPKTFVNIGFTAIGLLIITMTIIQTTSGLQGRWLSYRSAAERLRRYCMLFRAKLPPFDGPDAQAILDSQIEEISKVAHRQDSGEAQGRFSWKYAADLREMKDDSTYTTSTPDGGLLDGPLRDDSEVIDGRLRNQRRWYVAKAKRYFRDYLLMQLAIVGCSVFNVLHVLVFGERLFWLIVISSILSLGVIAFRDFLDYGPLFVRYLQTARNLNTIEEAYAQRHPPFDIPENQRLTKLAEQVEQTLASEFQYWIYTRR
jgi:hypothetical protein